MNRPEKVLAKSKEYIDRCDQFTLFVVIIRQKTLIDFFERDFSNNNDDEYTDISELKNSFDYALSSVKRFIPEIKDVEDKEVSKTPAFRALYNRYVGFYCNKFSIEERQVIEAKIDNGEVFGESSLDKNGIPYQYVEKQ